jgi:tetratricopeptide (TPR) repeat protein
MDTLYDLLGALPRDDAEDLRAAFRRAVKGTHPDLRPDDPDAALKFRQIVRANEILGDPEQRATYDHLLVLARGEQRSASVYRIAAKVQALASEVIALVGVSIMIVGGCLLFIHMPPALWTPPGNVDFAMRASPDIAAVSRPADSRNPIDESSLLAKGASLLAKRESASMPGEIVEASAAMPPINAESTPGLNLGAAPDPAPNGARFFRARGITAYRNGDLRGAIADLDLAIQLDPKLSASYIDRGIVFYRMRKFDRALADIARAKRLEKESRSKSTPMLARKPRFDQSGIAPSVKPQSPRRTAAKHLSPRQWFASVMQREVSNSPSPRISAAPTPDAFN